MTDLSKCSICGRTFNSPASVEDACVADILDGQGICYDCEQRGKLWACKKAWEEEQPARYDD